MLGRRLLAAATIVAAFLAGGARAQEGAQEPVFRLRPDPRLCPSPFCGGVFASLVNRPLTTCFDGTSRPACYAAGVVLDRLAQPARGRVRAELATGRALVAGRFAAYGPEFPTLARLDVAAAWLAAGPRSTGGTVYRVVDTGVRCARAPCFSLRATLVNGARTAALSKLDLAASLAPPAALARARAALSRTGVLVAGPIRRERDGGRALVASQLWLPA